MTTNAIELIESTKIQPADTRSVTRMPVKRDSMAPTTFGEMMSFAQMLAKSTFVPKDFVGKPENILVAIQWGMEIGLAPMQALQNIAVINGRPSLWGDAALAVVQNHPAYEWHTEHLEGDGDTRTGVFAIKRRGAEAHVACFTVADAKKAHLWGKQGPWTQYSDRMLCLRARGFGLRDKFADALKGLITTEEARDYPAENAPLMTTDKDGNMHPVPMPAVETKVVPAKRPKVSAMDNVSESVFIDSIVPKSTQGGVEYRILRSNNGDYFVFDKSFFDTLDANLGRTLTLGVKIDGKGRKTVISGLEPIADPILTEQLKQSLALEGEEKSDRVPF